MKRFFVLTLIISMFAFIGCTNFGDNSDSDTENNSSNTNNDYNPPSSDTGGNTGGGGSDEPYNPPTYSYTVIHYKSDTYETEEETFYATAGTTVTIVPKQYEFYHPDPDNSTQIEIDYDYRTVYLYYDRNEVKLTFDYNDGVSEIYEDTFYAGYTFYGSKLNKYPNLKKYVFKGWEPPLPDIVPNEDTTYTAQWSGYTVTPSIDIKLPTNDTMKIVREDKYTDTGRFIHEIEIGWENYIGNIHGYSEYYCWLEVNGKTCLKAPPFDVWKPSEPQQNTYSYSFFAPNEPVNPDLCNLRGICYVTVQSQLLEIEEPFHLGLNDVYIKYANISSEIYPQSFHFQILIEE